MRKLVELDEDALSWALAVLKDNRFNVEQRKQMTNDWRRKYDDAERYLTGLLALARRAAKEHR